ncbi:MAG: ABC transporter ATP-binding protein [Flavobacteriales bacterium]|nr:ABC transporter ATP-binding protein [Flavobacteriales bacterium]
MSENVVISVQNISKQYRLGMVGAGTLREDLSGWWNQLRGKEDPYLSIGETNDRTSVGDSDYVWALRDVNFDVCQGEVLGIVGKNGAGKSTLLKLLSSVTAPTTGIIKAKGRIASLLEVGTGFHPELTGKENIYLNGAIMGMRRAEITRKLDEIIEFAGVQRYVNTPVKRYSSGMYVRLAFSVAAHLEPEVLIVDEVLAVGDAEFQKKCLGKMGEVSKTGRTILFVSHNMAAVKALCHNAILLENGTVTYSGTSEEVVNRYLSSSGDNRYSVAWDDKESAPGDDTARLKSVHLECNQRDVSLIDVTTDFSFAIEFYSLKGGVPLNLSILLMNTTGECVFNVVSECKVLGKGIARGVCHVPGNLLNAGIYTISVHLIQDLSKSLHLQQDILQFEVHDNRDGDKWFGEWMGSVRPKLDFDITQISTH